MTITIATIAFDQKMVNGQSLLSQNFAAAPISAETLKISVTDPKPTKDYVGNQRAEGKLTFRDSAGAVKGIVSLNTSFRADQTVAEREAMLAVAAALAGHAAFKDASAKGKITL